MLTSLPVAAEQLSKPHYVVTAAAAKLSAYSFDVVVHISRALCGSSKGVKSERGATGVAAPLLAGAVAKLRLVKVTSRGTAATAQRLYFKRNTTNTRKQDRVQRP